MSGSQPISFRCVNHTNAFITPLLPLRPPRPPPPHSLFLVLSPLLRRSYLDVTADFTLEDGLLALVDGASFTPTENLSVVEPEPMTNTTAGGSRGGHGSRALVDESTTTTPAEEGRGIVEAAAEVTPALIASRRQLEASRGQERGGGGDSSRTLWGFGGRATRQNYDQVHLYVGVALEVGELTDSSSDRPTA